MNSQLGGDSISASPCRKSISLVLPAFNEAEVIVRAINEAHAAVSHVAAADLAEVLSGEGPFTVFAPTVEGLKVTIKVQDGTVMLDKAKVMKTDIPCKNGVIHVIDKVILPKA